MNFSRLASAMVVGINLTLFALDPNPVSAFCAYFLVTQQLLFYLNYSVWRYPESSGKFSNHLFHSIKDSIAFPVVLVELVIYWRFSRHKNIATSAIRKKVYGREELHFSKAGKMFFVGFMAYNIYKRDPMKYKYLQKIQKKIDELGDDDDNDKMMF